MIPLALGLIGKVAAAAVLPRMVKAVCDLVRGADNHRDSARERCTGEPSIRNNPVNFVDPSGLDPWATDPSFGGVASVTGSSVASSSSLSGYPHKSRLTSDNLQTAINLVQSLRPGPSLSLDQIKFVPRHAGEMRYHLLTGSLEINKEWYDRLDNCGNLQRFWAELVGALANETYHHRHRTDFGKGAEIRSLEFSLETLRAWRDLIAPLPDFGQSSDYTPIDEAISTSMNALLNMKGTWRQ